MTSKASLWRRITARLMAFAEAMEMSEAELQSRRINEVERRLQQLEQDRRGD